MPSVHPRCTQHGLVAPDGLCVLCRKQASSGPPAQQQGLPAPLRAADAASRSTDKCAALLVGVAIATMAVTYVLDTAKAKELAASRSEMQRQQAETERLQELLLAAAEVEEPQIRAAAAQVQEMSARDVDHLEDETREPQ